MWKAIRLHPWRLEIVPAAAFGFAVWWLHVYHTQAVPFVASMRDLHGADPFRLQVAWNVGWVAVLWLMEMGANHRWVESERRKRFNWMPLVFYPAIILRAWLPFVFTRMVLDIKHPSRPYEPFDFLLLGATVLIGLGLALLLERTRHYIAREETSEPPLPADAAGASSYHEIQIDWWFLPITPILLAMVLGLCTQRELAKGDMIMLLSSGVVATAVFLSLSIRTLSATLDLVTCKLGPIPWRFRTSDIVTCAPTHHETFAKQRDKKRKALGVTDGRCVEIAMKNGRIYRLGALRPNHICQLIAKPSADESKAES